MVWDATPWWEVELIIDIIMIKKKKKTGDFKWTAILTITAVRPEK